MSNLFLIRNSYKKQMFTDGLQLRLGFTNYILGKDKFWAFAMKTPPLKPKLQ